MLALNQTDKEVLLILGGTLLGVALLISVSWAIVFHGSPHLNRNFWIGVKLAALAGLATVAGLLPHETGYQGWFGAICLVIYLVSKFSKLASEGVFNLSEDEQSIGRIRQGAKTVMGQRLALAVTLAGVGAFVRAGYLMADSPLFSAGVLLPFCVGITLFLAAVVISVRSYRYDKSHGRKKTEEFDEAPDDSVDSAEDARSNSQAA